LIDEFEKPWLALIGKPGKKSSSSQTATLKYSAVSGKYNLSF